MAASHTTDIECVEALRAVAEHGTHRAAGRALGVDGNVITKRVAYAKERGLDVDTPIMDKATKLELELKKARQDIKALQREADTAERVRTEIFNFASRTVQPVAWLAAPSKSKAISKEVPCTIWSDWHYGEVVLPDEVGGMNAYNADIAAARVRSLVESTIDLCLNHQGRAEQKPPGIVVMLGGDMITGDIHEELTATNDRTTMQSVHELTDLIAAGLTRLADVFGHVFVPGVVGNHGRGTMKPRMKNRVWTSFEWLLYTALERHFRADKRIQFLIPNMTDAYFKVYGHRFLLTHGDSMGVKGGDGIIGALGPIMRGSMKVSRSEAQIGRDFDTLVIGHWHQDIYGPNDCVIVNNALKGYDEYARLAMRAGFSLASQQLWWVHPTRGITAKRKVTVQEPQHVEPSREWISWQN